MDEATKIIRRLLGKPTNDSEVLAGVQIIADNVPYYVAEQAFPY